MNHFSNYLLDIILVVIIIPFVITMLRRKNITVLVKSICIILSALLSMLFSFLFIPLSKQIIEHPIKNDCAKQIAYMVDVDYLGNYDDTMHSIDCELIINSDKNDILDILNQYDVSMARFQSDYNEWYKASQDPNFSLTKGDVSYILLNHITQNSIENIAYAINLPILFLLFYLILNAIANSTILIKYKKAGLKKNYSVIILLSVIAGATFSVLIVGKGLAILSHYPMGFLKYLNLQYSIDHSYFAKLFPFIIK